MHKYLHTYLCTYMYDMFIHSVHTCIHTYINMYAYEHSSHILYTHTYIPAYICTYVYNMFTHSVHTCIHNYTYKYACRYACMCKMCEQVAQWYLFKLFTHSAELEYIHTYTYVHTAYMMLCIHVYSIHYSCHSLTKQSWTVHTCVILGSAPRCRR